MSRILIFNLDGSQAGEIHANCNRGWAINEGGKATVALKLSDAVQPYLQLGRMAMVTHPRLPTWAGVIDTPWKAMQPGAMTIYNAEYLLSLRTPGVRMQLAGAAGKVAQVLLEKANTYESLRIVAGDIDLNTPSLAEETLEMRPVWELLTTYLKKHGMEITLRPDFDEANRIVIYMDVKPRLGVDTNYLLQDGDRPNMQITTASLEGAIWNSIIGNTNGSNGGADISTNAQIDDDSVQTYRMRSTVVQFPNQSGKAALLAKTQQELANDKAPFIKFTVNVLDQGDTFSYLRVGNGLQVHASKLVLPGGIQGWRGTARITAMAYDEGKNMVSMNLVGAL